MAATVRGTSLASGLGKSQVEFSESDGAQEAQEKVCRDGDSRHKRANGHSAQGG